METTFYMQRSTVCYIHTAGVMSGKNKFFNADCGDWVKIWQVADGLGEYQEIIYLYSLFKYIIQSLWLIENNEDNIP